MAPGTETEERNVVMDRQQDIPIFDGHNDTLLQLHLPKPGGERSFFDRADHGHLDLPRARAGHFGGGFFAVFVPSPAAPGPGRDQVLGMSAAYDVPLPPPLDQTVAHETALAMTARLFQLEAESGGQLQVVRTIPELTTCLQTGVLAAVLHFEGAEAIDPQLDTLEGLYQAGLRSLGLVWSRPNAFGHGVPFRFQSSPDTGPGLTAAGQELVRACCRLGILIDLSHLNERGFWDVAALSTGPLVATHSAVHALCPSSRNLTDRQLDAIRESGGLVGLNFAVSFLRADGHNERDTPLDVLIDHLDYLIARLGVDGVGFGSDFDGARVPQEIGDVAGLPRLLDALRRRGYDEPTIRKLAHENWVRVLRQTWRA